MQQSTDLRMMIYTAMFTALTIIGAYISIPIPLSPVPISMTNLFVILGGLLLGRKWGATSTMLYIFLGLVGLPVFAGGKGGLVHFIGPTGGYLVGFAVAAFVVGAIAESGNNGLIRDIVAALAGFAIIYIIGIPWLMYTLKLSLSKALASGALPFMPGAIIKAIAAVGLARLLRPNIRTHLAGVR